MNYYHEKQQENQIGKLLDYCCKETYRRIKQNLEVNYHSLGETNKSRDFGEQVNVNLVSIEGFNIKCLGEIEKDTSALDSDQLSSLHAIL